MLKAKSFVMWLLKILTVICKRNSTAMKKVLLAFLVLLPALLMAQVTTTVTYKLPHGLQTGIEVYTTEGDKPVWQKKAVKGRVSVVVKTKQPATGFMYIAATRRLFSFRVEGKTVQLTDAVYTPVSGDEDLAGSSPEIFPVIDKKFLDVTNSIKNLSVIPASLKDTAAARVQAKKYYELLQHLVVFTDSVVSLYPNNNVSLFTVFRLARWCSYSPDVYHLLSKLDSNLLKNDFAHELLRRQDKILKDSMDVAGKKPGGIVQKALTTTGRLKGGDARIRLLVYWDEFSKPANELLDDIKRLHLLFGNSQLQVNFLYTGTGENWEAMVKQLGLPAFANYLRCSRPDQKGTSPVITSSDNTCLLAGIGGYYLYQKVSQAN